MVDSSSLVMILDGAYIPQPPIRAFVVIVELLGWQWVGSSWIDLEQGLLALHERSALDEDAMDLAGGIGLDLVEQLRRLDMSSACRRESPSPRSRQGLGAGEGAAYQTPVSSTLTKRIPEDGSPMA